MHARARVGLAARLWLHGSEPNGVELRDVEDAVGEAHAVCLKVEDKMAVAKDAGYPLRHRRG